ncbi:MAG: UDP-N-acetylglucosamine 2-epimerase (hydrolyzing), partial [Thermoprotei archaeon]
MKRYILYVTGSRADYAPMKTTLLRIKESGLFRLGIVATNMHLSRRHGFTLKEVINDGFRVVAKISALTQGLRGDEMLRAFSKLLTELVTVVVNERPKIILVMGDRWEALAAAMVGNYLNKVVVHVHGGDVTGSLDEPNRHIITRFAHVHLVPTENHARRLIRMGEQRWRIYVVGSPGLDDIVEGRYAKPSEIEEKYSIDVSEGYILVVQHPVTTEVEQAGRQMRETLKAVLRTGLKAIIIYPNTDAGGNDMVKVINFFVRRYPQRLKAYGNLPRYDYLGLMANALAMVGNSSSALIEAPLFKLPVVNVGTRQEG